jgi:hypothetical protein
MKQAFRVVLWVLPVKHGVHSRAYYHNMASMYIQCDPTGMGKTSPGLQFMTGVPSAAQRRCFCLDIRRVWQPTDPRWDVHGE